MVPGILLDYLKDLTFQKIKNKWIKLNLQKKDNYKYHNNLVLNQNYIQFFKTSLPKQLNWSDINSMSHSIETRSPFLDYNFVEKVLPLPMKRKIIGIRSKYIIRETFKSIIPKKFTSEILKLVFGSRRAMDQKNKKYIEKIFKYYFKYVETFLSIECKNKAILIIRGKLGYRDWIWKIIFLGAWIKHHKLNL